MCIVYKFVQSSAVNNCPSKALLYKSHSRINQILEPRSLLNSSTSASSVCTEGIFFSSLYPPSSHAYSKPVYCLYLNYYTTCNQFEYSKHHLSLMQLPSKIYGISAANKIVMLCFTGVEQILIPQHFVKPKVDRYLSGAKV